MLQAPRTPKSLQDPPTGACGAPEHVKKPSDSLHGAYVKRPESPKRSQRASKDVLTKVRAAECAERLNDHKNDGDNSPDLASRACQILGIFALSFLG